MYLIPEQLETERLILRKPHAEDWMDLQAYYGDADCMRYTSGRAQEDWETWRKVATMIGHWEIHRYGPYVIIESESGKVIGITGLWFPHGWPVPEIKWGIAAKYQKKGYAKEGAKAVREMAAEYLPELHLISLIDPDNQASIHVAEGIGATYEKDIPFRNIQARIYRHIKA